MGNIIKSNSVPPPIKAILIEETNGQGQFTTIGE